MARPKDDPFMDEDLILPPQYSFTPIRALRMSSRKKIAQFLDLDGVLVVIGDLDVVNNYNGLAELIGFSYLDIRNIGLQKSPSIELLEQWTVKEQCENATIGNLWSFLYQMERFDVLKDCRRNIRELNVLVFVVCLSFYLSLLGVSMVLPSPRGMLLYHLRRPVAEPHSLQNMRWEAAGSIPR